MTTESTSLRSRLHADMGAVSGLPDDSTDAAGAPHYDLEGVEEPPEAQGFDPENAHLSDELPAGTALLCVKSTTYAGRPNFELYLHHRGGVRTANRHSDLDHRGRPDIGLPRLVELAAHSGWRSAYRRLKGWWKTEPTLMAWVDWLSSAERPTLVVWDQTPYEIPWELLYRQRIGSAPALDPAGDTGGWVGASVPVVRWTTVWDGTRASHYVPQPRKPRGGVLVYEDPEFAVPHDRVGEHETGTRATTMTELHHRLRDRRTTFGLLLMRCHGTYSTDPDKFTLGDVSLPELSEDWRMDALYENGAAVLINSCVSARPVADDRYNAAVPATFAEVFLRWGAGAVIATLAEVSKADAHDFAVRLLAGARKRPVNLAQALTEHRAHHAREAEAAIVAGDAERAETAIEGFFNGFMYAYFGHPGTTLSLEAPHAQACAGGERP